MDMIEIQRMEACKILPAFTCILGTGHGCNHDCSVYRAYQAGRMDVTSVHSFIAESICDHICKYADMTMTQKELDKHCNGCPVRRLMEDFDDE
ncbi:hypothetical protein [Mobilibacterium timonense]|uniref:hypothetical protein n=1 Tax=Mobilibacterium timonense TaxID=1871012 RepID=UPI00098410F9|nr:hypothetical protein [Mobilibacterium timonense]